MPMSTSAFLAQFKQLKAYLEAHPDASEELKTAYAEDTAAFKQAYTPEARRRALADNESVGSDLEERMTSTLILLSRDRARRAAS